MKTITFYSYKGGVGRSLALANIALRLSEFDKRICMLDFDLEAPGLAIKFSQYIKQEIRYGLVDYIHEYTSNGRLPKKVSDYTLKFDINRNKNLYLIPAGNTGSADYWKKLSSIDWYNLVYESNHSISFFLDFKEKIKNEIDPDFLLIDSRTGISEMSGISISLLADDVVIVSAHNEENLAGSKKIIDNLLNTENSILGKSPKITFILSRIPLPDSPEEKGREQLLTDRVQKRLNLQNENFFVIHSDRELEIDEQLRIAQGPESVPLPITRDYLRLFERLTKDVLTQAETDRFENIKKAERLFIFANKEKILEKKLEMLNEAIGYNDQNVEMYLFRGLLYSQLKKYDLALGDYLAADALNISLRPITYNIIGGLYLFQNDFTKALEYFSKNVPWSYQGMGDTFTRMGEYKQAIESYDKAIANDPKEASNYNNRSNAYRLLGQTEEALIDAFKALELAPNIAINHLTLAEVYATLRKQNEFYLALENALKINSEDAQRLIPLDLVYKPFYKEDRFVKLMDKYNVIL